MGNAWKLPPGEWETPPYGALGESIVGTQLYTRGLEGKALSERSYTPSCTMQPEPRPVGTGRCWWLRRGVNHLMAEIWAGHTSTTRLRG